MLKLSGYDTGVLFLGDADKATKELVTQITIAEKLNIPVTRFTDLLGTGESADNINEKSAGLMACRKIFEKYDVLVDGIFGVGLSREITGYIKYVIEAVNESGKHVVAVDVPSGVDCATGNVWELR